MPLPVAHTGIGIACYLSLPQDQVKKLNTRKKVFLLFMFACLANIPDMDFIPGILVGQPNLYHHGPSHSLIVALIVAYITYVMTSRYYYELENKRFLVALLIASTSHTLLDYFSKDTGQP